MKRRKRIYLVVLLVLIAGFVLLTAFVHMNPLSAIDIGFTRSVQVHRNPMIDMLMRIVSYPGSPPNSFILVPLTSLIFLFFKLRKEALFIFLTSISGLVSWSLKLLVNRPRPGKDLVAVLVHTRDQSFPSGHTLFYVTFFGMLLIIMITQEQVSKFWRWTVSIVSALMIFLVPLSRIYLGAHWFTDVNAGFVAGLFCLAVLSYFYLFRRNPRSAVH